MDDFEEIRCQLIAELYQLDSADVLKLGKDVLRPGLVTEVHTKYQVLRSVHDYLETLKIQEQLQRTNPSPPVSQPVDDRLAREEEKLQETHQAQLRQPEENFQKQMKVFQLKPPKTEGAPMASVTSTQFKELRINGQIGEAYQKEKLSFSSLKHQMDAARLKGYNEAEIIEAVLKAINPSLKLRSYLENHTNLILTILKSILKTHFKEKDGTELYQELSSLSQGKNETAPAFIVRALDLRQRVLMASEEQGDGLMYEPKLVKQMFLHAVLTGLSTDMQYDIKPYLTIDIPEAKRQQK